MSGSFIQAIRFVIEVSVFFLSTVLLLRFWMQIVRAPFAHQGGQFILQLTDWLVVPLRRIIPGLFGADLASILLAIALHIFKVIFLFLLLTNLGLGGLVKIPPILLWVGVVSFLRTALHLLIISLVAQAILSWIQPYSFLSSMLNLLTEPILRPVRRVVPLIANIDLSPLVVIILIQIVLIFLT